MELRHLRYFLAVAEENHFRRAAERLLVSQPTLSLQVQELEHELGVALFDRIGRRVRLTQAGQVFREHARRVLGVLEDGKTALAEIDGLARGSLAVGAVQTVSTYTLPPVVARFSTAHPNVRLRVEERSAGNIEEGLLDGSLDLGISFLPTNRKEIEVERLFEEELVLAVPPAHRLAARERVRVTELAGEPLCLLASGFCTRRIIEECFDRADARPTVVVELNSVASALAVVEAGGPATILPELGTRGRALKCVRIEKPTPKRTVGLLRLRDQTPLRARTVFANLLKETLGQKRPPK